MSKQKKQTGRYIIEINDWGCGTLIKDTLTGKEIDAPAEDTVNLCIKEMNRLAFKVERLTKAGDAMAQEVIGCYFGEGYDPADSESLREWNAAKGDEQSV